MSSAFGLRITRRMHMCMCYPGSTHTHTILKEPN